MPDNPRIALLMTGDEIMRGDTIDSNSAVIAQQFTEHSLDVTEKVTVGDDRELLLAALARLTADYDLLVINGGLGPTTDDLTAEVTAGVAGSELVEHPGAREHVEAWCARRGIQANRANLKQAWLPEGADLIANPVGSAVGFALEIGGCLVLTTPGVPSELRAMLPELIERTVARVGGSTAHTLRLQTFGIGESTIQQRIHDGFADWPDTVRMGFRAGMPQLELKLIVSDSAQLADQEACLNRFHTLFGDHIIGTGDTTLGGALQAALRQRGMKATTAESCTGGLIASMITREAGSSAVFEAGYVTYSNRIKQATLGVSEEDLATHGAVSEPVVRQMLAGALAASGADIGVAVSGIAGPDGGTEDKPVGTVWLAWGTRESVRTRKMLIPGDRSLFQTLVAAAGLDLMRRQLLELPPEPHYFTRQSI